MIAITGYRYKLNGRSQTFYISSKDNYENWYFDSNCTVVANRKFIYLA